jgi:hypothetical protein
MRSFFLSCIVVLALTAVAAAQPKGEAEHLVPPQGGAMEVPVHAGAVCILSFPEKLAPQALTSSPDFETKMWGDDGIAVRAARAKAAPATLALATIGGRIKVNVTLRVVPEADPALTMVRFKAASAAEAFEAQVRAGIEKRIAPIEARLKSARKNPRRADSPARRGGDRRSHAPAQRDHPAQVARVQLFPGTLDGSKVDHLTILKCGRVGGSGFGTAPSA